MRVIFGKVGRELCHDDGHFDYSLTEGHWIQRGDWQQRWRKPAVKENEHPHMMDPQDIWQLAYYYVWRMKY